MDLGDKVGHCYHYHHHLFKFKYEQEHVKPGTFMHLRLPTKITRLETRYTVVKTRLQRNTVVNNTTH